MMITLWQYKVRTYKWGGEGDLEMWLITTGTDGWEAIGPPTVTADGEQIWTFKRPLVETFHEVRPAADLYEGAIYALPDEPGKWRRVDRIKRIGDVITAWVEREDRPAEFNRTEPILLARATGK